MEIACDGRSYELPIDDIAEGEPGAGLGAGIPSERFMNDGAALGLVLDQVSKDKNIDRAVLVETLEQAILTAAKRAFGMHREMEAKFNEETGRVDLFQIIVIVDQVTPGRATGKEVPHRRTPSASASRPRSATSCCSRSSTTRRTRRRPRSRTPKYGELLKLNRAWKGFGRIAAQTAKQVILQRVREAERENVFNEYKDRKGELISGIVRRFERGNIIVDLGGAEAVLPVREQVPRESYRAGDRIVAYVVDIDKTARGPQIILSRTHKGLLEKLFEMEVPEIYEKIVRIEASAREPGARSKIAVSSRDRDVDPVGACVGMKGSRVQAVVQELRGEKIDIVPYDPRSGALRLQRDRAGRGRARHHRRRQPHDGADRPRRQAVAGHRQEGPERAPRVAADRLAHRHPLGVEGARDGGSGRAQSLAAIEGGAATRDGWPRRCSRPAGVRRPRSPARSRTSWRAVPGVGGAEAAARHRCAAARRPRSSARRRPRRRARQAEEARRGGRRGREGRRAGAAAAQRSGAPTGGARAWSPCRRCA